MGYLKRVEFWVMVAAWVAHSLSATIFTVYGFVVWSGGIALIWFLYCLGRFEARRREGVRP